jgi:hypothetical protein
MSIRPTGIIRTLNSLSSADPSIGREKYEMSMKLLEAGRIEAIYLALPGVPRHEVLHIYLIIDGEIQVRLNIAGYEPGSAEKCWDEKIREPKTWAVCTGPVSRPPEPIKRRGFQGFRYTEDLW